jgi:hypothetical protein
MRFKEAYEGYQCKRLSQSEAATLLGVCDRSFRRYMVRYEQSGTQGLLDRRLNEPSHRRAPVDEVIELQALYSERYRDWNVRHFHRWYQYEHNGSRSYSWVKKQLQSADLVRKTKKRGPHRIKRLASALPGMMIHQDGSTHQWIDGEYWDLIVTMDDATNEHYSMRFVDEEGTHSSLLGVKDVLQAKGLFCSFYSDRGSHYWHTPEAGGKVDKSNPTQFGVALKRLGIDMIAAYSPEARDRSERAFGTHQGRLPNELALKGITTISAANEYLSKHYMPAFNAEFSHPAREKGNAFVPLAGIYLDDYLCEQFERTVGKDNCVQFENLHLQLPASQHCYHYVKAKVKVLKHLDKTISVYHGPRFLGKYTNNGKLMKDNENKEITKSKAA